VKASLLSVRGHETTPNWYTPAATYLALDHQYGPFMLDPCCTDETRRTPRWIAPPRSGLAETWGPCRVFLNPPYGRGIADWIRKAIVEARAGAFVVALIPSSTGAGWWHELVIPNASAIVFLRGKLRFGGQRSNAPFWSAVATFGHNLTRGDG